MAERFSYWKGFIDKTLKDRKRRLPVDDIDNVVKRIERQIKLMGINQVIKRYSIMLDELRFTINEQVDTKRASVLSDIEEVLENILYSIKERHTVLK